MDTDGPGKPYLALCGCLGYDAPYLLEWVEFYRLVGVERFFLYNNGDRAAQERLLAPYVEEGTVVLHDWPQFPPQNEAFQHCLDEHGDESRWIAFVDTDEFLFSPTGRPLPDVLREYEEFPGVVVHWVFFGTSGHETRPPGLVTENYVRRSLAFGGNRYIKSIVDPARVERCLSPHHFSYRDGHAVDEERRPVDGPLVEPVSISRLRINHYWTKSEEEWELKFSRLRPDDGDPRRRTARQFARLRVTLNEDPDDGAIARYLPDLREAVERAQQRAWSDEVEVT
jgi:Glycosyltransferase family 92